MIYMNKMEFIYFPCLHFLNNRLRYFETINVGVGAFEIGGGLEIFMQMFWSRVCYHHNKLMSGSMLYTFFSTPIMNVSSFSRIIVWFIASTCSLLSNPLSSSVLLGSSFDFLLL